MKSMNNEKRINIQNMNLSLTNIYIEKNMILVLLVKN